jgi:hypothetical protein
LKAPDYLDGSDLSPALADPARVVKTAAYSQLRRPNGDNGYSVRAGKWRYTEWTGKSGAMLGRQLFDEESDSSEARNLASDPVYAATVSELSALLQPVRNQKPPVPSAVKPSGNKEG